MKTRPNILLIITDQQSATMLGCAGNKHLDTPAMDYIAQNGVRFEKAYCTNPVCLPSRFSLMTGRMPSYTNIRSNFWRDETTGIPEHIVKNGIGHLFKEAGYDAVYGGKTHLPGFEAEDLGFRDLTANERDELADVCAGYIRKYDNEAPFFMTASFINPHDICFMAIKDFADASGIDMGTAILQGLAADENGVVNKDKVKEKKDEFLEKYKDQIIREGKKGKADPLKIIQDIIRKKDQYEPEYFFKEICPPLPDNFELQEEEPEALEKLFSGAGFVKYARDSYSEERWKLHRWVYSRLVERVDKKIQKLIDALKESGKEENTVVIFTSDHGEHDGAHKLVQKHTLYEEACRVPFIIAQKGRTNGGSVDGRHLVSNGLDLIPTLCDYAGITHPETDLEGISLRPIVEGKEPEGWRKAVKIESEFGRAIVMKDFKYALYFDGRNNEQLYDLERDPGEMRNAACDECKQELIKEMRAEFNKAFM